MRSSTTACCEAPGLPRVGSYVVIPGTRVASIQFPRALMQRPLVALIDLTKTLPSPLSPAANAAVLLRPPTNPLRY